VREENINQFVKAREERFAQISQQFEVRQVLRLFVVSIFSVGVKLLFSW